MPQFGATFYPGGVDDFSMPEVIAPAPQRLVIVPIPLGLFVPPAAEQSEIVMRGCILLTTGRDP